MDKDARNSVEQCGTHGYGTCASPPHTPSILETNVAPHPTPPDPRPPGCVLATRGPNVIAQCGTVQGSIIMFILFYSNTYRTPILRRNCSTISACHLLSLPVCLYLSLSLILSVCLCQSVFVCL